MARSFSWIRPLNLLAAHARALGGVCGPCPPGAARPSPCPSSDTAPTDRLVAVGGRLPRGADWWLFLLSGWSQSREDIQFAYKLAETAKGRVFFTAGKELDRFVVWDYVSRRRSIIG